MPHMRAVVLQCDSNKRKVNTHFIWYCNFDICQKEYILAITYQPVFTQSEDASFGVDACSHLVCLFGCIIS
jgi:hypothetical protein